jgi:quercetin dioxygenase-like cupin family protein
MISLNKDMPVFPGRPGVSERRPIHDPSAINVQEWTYDPGTQIHAHGHNEASIAYIIKGKLKVKLAGEESLLEAGCYYFTPPNVVHEITEILEQTTILTVAVPAQHK